MTDIIIIGGGAAGCMAAHLLSKAGKKIIVLEAKNRLGGRIFSYSDPSFSHTVEAGAEFVHGNLPVTFKVLKEGKIRFHEVKGKNWVSKDGKLYQDEDMIGNWDVLTKRIRELNHDMPLQDFLDKHLPEPHFAELKQSVRAFVEGYDAADMNKVSSFSIRKEWSNEDQWEQHRVDDGYAKMIDYLEQQAASNGCMFHLSSPVTEIIWEEGKVQVKSNENAYESEKILLTVPVGVLQLRKGEEGFIAFTPSVDAQLQAAQEIGFGSVIKVLLEFNNAFWYDIKDSNGNSLSKLSYLFSKCAVPTWWTQYPKQSSLLTGWLGGPKAGQLKNEDNDHIVTLALDSLSEIFSIDVAVLRKKLKASSVENWGKDPYTRGAYSYATVQSLEAKKLLMSPVDDTIYFAGEGLYAPYDASTVETALASAENICKKILNK